MSRIRAPEFPANFPVFNISQSLSLTLFRGRIVLLDFWTYGCINCLHILPDLKDLEKKYADFLTVIGVHAGKFPQEKIDESVSKAIQRHQIKHPVIVDHHLTIWEQYTVKAWPTFVLIDPEGYIVSMCSGEGNRAQIEVEIEEMIRAFQLTPKRLELSWEKNVDSSSNLLSFPGKVLAVGKGNRLFIADSGNHRIVVSTTEGEVLKIIGTGEPGWKDGAFHEAQFFNPQGMVFLPAEEALIVADMDNHVLRKLDLNRQEVETIAGTGEQNKTISICEGKALEIALNSPWDLHRIDHRLWIAMAGSHQIWELELETGKLRTYAGNGRESCVDGNLLEAAFAQPCGITSDGFELLVADSEGSSIRSVGLWNHPQVKTLCGGGDLFEFGDGDGRGNKARLQHCLGVEYTQNYVWIADTYNHKIKRLDHRTGLCMTILGDGIGGHQDGVGHQTRFSEPSGLSAIGPHLFVADTNNHCIRQVELETLEVITLPLRGLV